MSAQQRQGTLAQHDADRKPTHRIVFAVRPLRQVLIDGITAGWYDERHVAEGQRRERGERDSEHLLVRAVARRRRQSWSLSLPSHLSLVPFPLADSSAGVRVEQESGPMRNVRSTACPSSSRPTKRTSGLCLMSIPRVQPGLQTPGFRVLGNHGAYPQGNPQQVAWGTLSSSRNPP